MVSFDGWMAQIKVRIALHFIWSMDGGRKLSCIGVIINLAAILDICAVEHKKRIKQIWLIRGDLVEARVDIIVS